jgi:hypothetical protein
MKCDICEKEMDWSIQVNMWIPKDVLFYLSKKNIRRKDVEIIGVDWSNAKPVCRNEKCMEDFKNKEELKKVKELLREAYDHLNFCNYGDSYEKECSLDLRNELNEYFKETDE